MQDELQDCSHKIHCDNNHIMILRIPDNENSQKRKSAQSLLSYPHRSPIDKIKGSSDLPFFNREYIYYFFMIDFQNFQSYLMKPSAVMSRYPE